MKIKEMSEVLNGYAFKSSNYINEGYRVVRITNVQSGYIEDEKPVYYEFDNKLEKYELKENDLLISLTGNVGRCALVTKDFLPAYLNQRVCCLRINKEKVIPKFLYYILNSKKFEFDCINSSQGIAQLNMSTEWLKEYNLEIPAIELQKKIINIFDKVYNNINIKKNQINSCNNLIKSQFVEMFGNYDLTTNLSKYIKELRGGKSLAGTDECVNKVLKTGAATFGWFDSNQFKYLPKNYMPLQEHKVETGDVIISRMNTPELVGACSYVFKAPDNMYYPDRLWKTILKDKNNPIFLWQLLWDDKIRKQIKENSAGTSGTMQNISKQKLLEIKCIDVPIELQNKFAKIVEQIDKQKFVNANLLQLLVKSLKRCYNNIIDFR